MKCLMLFSKFTNYFKELFVRQLFSFKGRANRKEYIIRLTTSFILFTLINVFDDSFFKSDLIITILLDSTIAIVGLMYCIQYFPLLVRRLHDLDYSGWWSLAYIMYIIFTPFVILIPSISKIIIILLMFIHCIIGLYFVLKKGTPGPNKYGEQPME